MRIVIIGCGKVGETLVKGLVGEGHNVTVMDNVSANVESLLGQCDVSGICGSALSYNDLIEAGVDKSDLTVAVTQSDEINMLCCAMAKKMGSKYTCARVRNPELTGNVKLIQKDLGVDMTVNPDMATARAIYNIISLPSALNVESFAGGRCSLTEITVEEGGELDNMQIAHIRKLGIKFLICAVERDGETFIPNGSTVLRGGDNVYVCAGYSEQNKLFKKLHIYVNRPKYVMIIGGSKIALYLSKMLTKTGIKVKIIEKNKDRCYELAEALPDAEIICIDGTDQDQLLQEGLSHTDACISLTDLDEQNLVIAFFAQSLGVTKCVTKISKNTLRDMLKNIGLDSSVSPNDLTANTILQYVRAMDNSFDVDSVRSLYRLVNSSIEAAEFVVPSDFTVEDKPLKEVKLKPQVLIACILRGSGIIIPSGDDCLKAGDTVIAVSKNLILSELEDVLA